MQRMAKRLAAVAVTAAMGLAVGAAAASADGFDLTGGDFTGTATADQELTIDGVYTSTCSTLDVDGNTEAVTGTPAALAFGFSFASCTAFGFPPTITSSGSWQFEVTSKISSSPPTYAGQLRFPSGSSTTIHVPIAGCSWTVAGPQTFTHGAGGNVVTAVQNGSTLQISVSIQGISYTASGCPFGSGSNMTYDSNGPIDLPGVTVDEL